MEDAEATLRAEKARVRQAMLARRAALDAVTRERLGALAQGHLLAHPAYARACTVMFYWAMGAECPTQAAIRAALDSGRRVALPRVVRWRGAVPPGPAPVWGRNGRGLAVHRFTGAPDELVPGPFGLTEPAAGLPPVDPGELDLVVVPGVAFAPDGGRIGFGGGYYDHFLPHVPRTVPRLGLAYRFQVLAQVPRGPGDQGVDLVVTDEGIAAPGAGGSGGPGC